MIASIFIRSAYTTPNVTDANVNVKLIRMMTTLEEGAPCKSLSPPMLFPRRRWPPSHFLITSTDSSSSSHPIPCRWERSRRKEVATRDGSEGGGGDSPMGNA